MSRPRGHALMRRPAQCLAQGLTLKTMPPVDLSRALQQWQEYMHILEQHGWKIILVDEIEAPDSVFIEDPCFVLPKRDPDGKRVLILPTLTAKERRGEMAGVLATLERHADELNIRVVRLPSEATMDGGDVLRVGDTLYVGRSARTTPAAIRELRRLNAPHPVVAVPVTKHLHLKSCCTALPDGTVIGHPDLVDNPSLFERYLPIEASEHEGSHVIHLTEDTLLCHASAPKTAALLENLGYEVIKVDVSEFEKLDGCVTCLSVLIPGDALQ